MDSEIKSLPLQDLYVYNEELWKQLEEREKKIRFSLEKMGEIAQGLTPLYETLSKKAGGVGDDFWA
jgi:hypothetical protein